MFPKNICISCGLPITREDPHIDCLELEEREEMEEMEFTRKMCEKVLENQFKKRSDLEEEDAD